MTKAQHDLLLSMMELIVMIVINADVPKDDPIVDKISNMIALADVMEKEMKSNGSGEHQ
jgi:Ni,Fe-hydrogenase III component G